MRATVVSRARFSLANVFNVFNMANAFIASPVGGEFPMPKLMSTFDKALDAKSRRQRRCSPLIQTLGNARGVEHLTDANLKYVHDIALLLLMGCQGEFRCRGMPHRYDLLPVLAEME